MTSVIPIPQSRGRFRTDYEGATFREVLGLPAPANRHAAREAGSVA